MGSKDGSSRSRYVALGATLAMVLGAGGVLTSSAAGGTVSSFVPITPCRLLDTRPPGDNVGTRATPISTNETFTTTVWGTNGNCTIPNTCLLYTSPSPRD